MTSTTTQSRSRQLPAGFSIDPSCHHLVCPHREKSCCLPCAALHPEIEGVGAVLESGEWSGVHFWEPSAQAPKPVPDVAAAFAKHAARYGLVPTDIGRTFTAKGRAFTVAGCSPRSRKYPILCTDVDGREFKFQAAHVARELNSCSN